MARLPTTHPVKRREPQRARRLYRRSWITADEYFTTQSARERELTASADCGTVDQLDALVASLSRTSAFQRVFQS
jgi:hypothetical protein